jgi:uncharacterized protein
VKIDVQEIIGHYNLKRHPEGGYFREVYRSEQIVHSNNVDDNRNAVTDIYFLLTKGELSRFHKVLHDELWHFYSGAPLRLIDYNGVEVKEIILDGSFKTEFQYPIKAGHFQAAESLGDYSLLGCIVAPGFNFKDFSFMENKEEQNKLISLQPNLKKFI